VTDELSRNLYSFGRNVNAICDAQRLPDHHAALASTRQFITLGINHRPLIDDGQAARARLKRALEKLGGA
jgi:hypothetical protein